jgi:hypothetical protein
MVSAQQLLAVMCPLLEEALNDSDLKTDLGIPPTIHFQVTPLEGGAGSLPVKITAAGEGFSADALYDAENKLRNHLTTQMPSLPTWPIYDH